MDNVSPAIDAESSRAFPRIITDAVLASALEFIRTLSDRCLIIKLPSKSRLPENPLRTALPNLRVCIRGKRPQQLAGLRIGINGVLSLSGLERLP